MRRRRSTVLILSGFALLLPLGVLFFLKSEDRSATGRGAMDGGRKEVGQTSVRRTKAIEELIRTGRESKEHEEARQSGPGDGRGSLIVDTNWDDGEPAPNIALRVRSYEDGAVQTGSTNDQGVAEFDGIRVGRVAIYSNRGVGIGSRVAAGEQSRVSLLLLRGRRVRGQVVDEDGNGIAGASIVLATLGFGGRGLVATQTGQEGRFEFAGVGERVEWIGAMAEGYRPSKRRGLSRNEIGAEPVSLTISLAGKPLAIEGRVFDGSTGSAVAGAEVFMRSDSKAWIPATAKSDQHGAFRIEAGPGRAEILVDARGFAVWKDVIDTDANRPITVELVVGIGLGGVVLDNRRRPIPGAFVGIGRNGSWDEVSVQTDEKGRYHLFPIAPGTWDLLAQRRGFGSVKKSLVLETHEEGLELIIDPGRVFSGLVRDTVGEPVSGWTIRASGPESGSRSYVQTSRTGGDGRFTLTNVVDDTLDLRVFDAGRPRQLVKSMRSVRTDVDDLEIVVEEEASGYVRGRLLGGDDLPYDGHLEIGRSDGTGGTKRFEISEATGEFVVGPMYPSDYDLFVCPSRFGRIQVSQVRVETSADKDLGVLRVDHPGSIVVSLRFRSGDERRPCEVGLIPLTNGCRSRRSRLLATEIGVPVRLPSGRYIVVVSGPKVATKYEIVDLELAEQHEVELPVVVGWPVNFIFESVSAAKSVAFRAICRDGSIVSGQAWKGESGEFRATEILHDGAWAVFWGDAGGRRGGETEFQVAGREQTVRMTGGD